LQNDVKFFETPCTLTFEPETLESQSKAQSDSWWHAIKFQNVLNWYAIYPTGKHTFGYVNRW